MLVSWLGEIEDLQVAFIQSPGHLTIPVQEALDLVASLEHTWRVDTPLVRTLT